MDYAAEIERIAVEARRRSANVAEEIDEIHRQTALRAERFAAETTERLQELADQDQVVQDPPEVPAESSAPPPSRTPEPVRPSAPRPPEAFEPDPNWTPEQLRQAEIRAAVARARAARQARSTVAPSDGDYDPESEYYRRSTWLD
ncbi:hypothetical protein [Nocardia rosealba]|uniref:hypothetical protein n=1 Tax=Nocardia rosealba TaxID=2878563 RepID=UPI001CDA2C21|nr:hypothetical protein [Nocardia rosealba]MCA2210297.1 hypothetical protein [Nocardia rosealba]